jgi:hypothetical protein
MRIAGIDLRINTWEKGKYLLERQFTFSVLLCLGHPWELPLHKNADVEHVTIVSE